MLNAPNHPSRPRGRGSVLVRGAEVVVTMDGKRRELKGASILV